MKNNSLHLLLLFVLLQFQISSAQEVKNIDSLLNLYKNQTLHDTTRLIVLEKLFEANLYNDFSKAEKYIREKITLAKKIDDNDHLTSGYLGLGDFFQMTEQNDSSALYYQKCLDYYQGINDTLNAITSEDRLAGLEFKKGNYKKADSIFSKNILTLKSLLGDSKEVAKNYDMLSRVNHHQGYYKIALQYSLKAIGLFQKLKDETSRIDALLQLAVVEERLMNLENAVKYNIECLEYYDKINDLLFLGVASTNLGNCYYYLKQYDKAEEYFNNSVEISKRLGEEEFDGVTYTNLGRVYFGKKEYNKALNYVQKGLKINKKVGISKYLIEDYIMLGRIYYNMKSPSQALQFINTSIFLADSIGSKGDLALGYELRSKIHEDLKKKNLALEDHKSFHNYKELVYDEKKLKQIEEMRAIFDTEKKEQQIARQETEIALLEEKDKVSLLQKWLLGSGLGLSLLVFGFGFYGIRQRMKRNKAEREKVAAELAFKKKELTTQALHLAKKNETLENLKQKAKELQEQEATNDGYQQLITSINFDLKDDNNWENFARYFEEVHKDFNSNVAKAYPDVTPNELRLMALLKMNLSSKEIANILNISIPGIKKARQRLRKKMNLSTSDSLENAVLSI
ncbi:MAG: tetratricopeptide repeat protein [Croceivirga sp.]